LILILACSCRRSSH